MKSVWGSVLLLCVLFGLAACSAADEAAKTSLSESASDSASYEEAKVGPEESPVEEASEAENQNAERMIIHKAIIRTQVKNLKTAQHNVEQKVKKYGGYIVESNIYQNDEQSTSGDMVVRIPEKHFETFLTDTEAEASKVLERNVTGQDVTEQYVDINSRIKSKRAVEERLLAFMKNAEKTEDLLKISADLSNVQEEIEVLVGKVKYLENQTSFSTIELTMVENRVIVPGLDNKELNTWEKTKKQFVTSTNALLSFGSGVVIFFIGNLPVFIVLGVIAIAVYWIIKRSRKVK